MDIAQLGSIATSIVIGYVLGSVPVAYHAARTCGVNILEVGTRNPGAANVFRTVSRPLGILVLLLDTLKGFLAVAIANILSVESAVVPPLAGAAATVGHWYPLLLRFRGGAGLATAIGAGIGLVAFPGLIALAPALLTLKIIRNTGYAAGIGYTCFICLSLILGTAWEAALGATLLGVMVFLRDIVTRSLQHRRGGE